MSAFSVNGPGCLQGLQFLEGSGLVLQNNGTDDLPINSDGPFEFPTPLTPGTFYDVTVAANPTSPGQTCSVANGSGQVPDQDVTDVVVTCADPTFSELVKVAAEGDTLPDDTVICPGHGPMSTAGEEKRHNPFFPEFK